MPGYPQSLSDPTAERSQLALNAVSDGMVSAQAPDQLRLCGLSAIVLLYVNSSSMRSFIFIDLLNGMYVCLQNHIFLNTFATYTVMSARHIAFIVRFSRHEHEIYMRTMAHRSRTIRPSICTQQPMCTKMIYAFNI